MAEFLDNCGFTPSAGGTTDWTYSSTPQGYQSPAAADVVNSAVYKYHAFNADRSEWEIGEGAYNTGTGVLARTTVLYNSSGTGTGAGQTGAGTKINFTIAPTVAIVALKGDLANLSTPNSFTDTTEATGAGTTAAAIFAGGVEIAKKLFVAGVVTITASTASTTTTDGALVVTGGVGIGGVLNGVTATLTGGTLADGGRVLAATATLPASPSTTAIGASFTITSNGSAAQAQVGMTATLAAGYTGSSATTCISYSNGAAGTASTLISAAGSNTVNGNSTISSSTTGTTTGLNVGTIGRAANGDLSVGVFGVAQVAKNSAKNIGVAGSAINTGTSPVHVGGWFSLNQTTVPTVSAALIADNGSQTAAIFLARDNGSTVFTIADGGNVTSTGVVSGATLHVTSDGNSLIWGTGTSSIVGNSAANVLVFYTNSTERVRIGNTQVSISPTTASTSTTTGALIVAGGVGIAENIYAGGLIVAAGMYSTGAMKCSHATAGLGYDTGAGGTVTQATNKSTDVTLNKSTGKITMNNAALAAATIVSFTVTCSAVVATDSIVIMHESGGTLGSYTVNARATGAGTFAVDVRNNTAGSLSEALVLRYAVIKSVDS